MINAIVLLFGLLICLAGAWGLIAPGQLLSLLGRWQGQSRFLVAVIVRLIFGALLIGSPESFQFPTVMKILGIISLAAGIFLLLIGQERMDRFIAWLLAKPVALFRVSFVFTLLFGGFLVYAAS